MSVAGRADLIAQAGVSNIEYLATLPIAPTTVFSTSDRLTGSINNNNTSSHISDLLIKSPYPNGNKLWVTGSKQNGYFGGDVHSVSFQYSLS